MAEKLYYDVPFHQIPNALIEDERTSVYHQAVFGVLAMHANREGSCWPSYARIARLAGISRRKAVSTVEDLETMGWLKIKDRQSEDGSPSSNLYYLQQSLQGSAPGAPPLVQEVHHPSARGAPELYSLNKNQQNNKAARPPLTKMRDPVANRFQERFIAVVPDESWGSYPKERKALATLGENIARIAEAAGAEGSVIGLADIVFDQFMRLRRANNSQYWRSAPVTPSALLARWDGVMEEVRKRTEDERNPFV